MKYRRALLLTELDAGARPALSLLRRVAPELERILIVARLPSPTFASLLAESATEPDLASVRALALLQRQAAAAAPSNEVKVAPELDASALGELAHATQADLLVAGSPSLRSASILVEAQKRLGLALLWPVGDPAAQGPIENVCCVARGSGSRTTLARFLHEHAAGLRHVSVLSSAPPKPEELAALLEIAGIHVQVEVFRAGVMTLRSWLEQRPPGRALDLVVVTRLPTPLLLGLSWPAPVLLLPPPAGNVSVLERELDVTDVISAGGPIRARVDHAATVGSLTPAPDQALAFVCAGEVVATARTSASGEVELPAGLAVTPLGVLKVQPDAPLDALAGVEHCIAVIRPGEVPLLVFDAELPDELLRGLSAFGFLELLAVRLRPTRTARGIRQRLRALNVVAPVVDARAVLDEGPAFDVAEANDPVRLARVAVRLKRSGFAVAALFHRGLAEPQPLTDVRAQNSSGNRVEVELDNARARGWLFEAIASSQASLHLQVYMVGDDPVSRAIEAALADAASRGVAVRVLVDSLHGRHGSFGAENPVLARLSQRPGVELRISRPVRGLPSLVDLKQRDHRKLVVIDGRLALLGGRNVAREYYTGFDEVGLTAQSTWREVPWLDAGARIEGPAVGLLASAFLQAWTEAGGAAFEVTTPPCVGGTALGLVEHRGLVDAHSLEAYLELIESARAHLYVVNGFPLMLELQHALLVALRRGVRVRVLTGHLTPTHAGRPFDGTWSTARTAATEFVHSRLDAVVEAGGEAYFFACRDLPSWAPDLGVVHPHVHAKLISVDGRRCSVGSANLDITSSYWESELCVVVDDAAIAGAVELELGRLIADSTRWDPGDPAWRRLALRRSWMRRWPGVLSL